MLDYIEAIRPYCDVSVLVPGHERRAGITRCLVLLTAFSTSPAVPGSGVVTAERRLGRLELLRRLGNAAESLPNVDLIHAHGVVFNGLPASKLGARLGVPVVLTVHTGPFDKLLRRSTIRRLTRRTLERVDVSARSVMTYGADRKRRHQAETNGRDLQPGRHRSLCTLDTRGPRRRIAFAGRLEEYKGGLRVVRAFAEIAERWPGWTLSIGGDGPERPAIQAFLDDNRDLNGRVELVGECYEDRACGPVRHVRLLRLSEPARDLRISPCRGDVRRASGHGPNCTAPPEYIDARSGLPRSPDDIAGIARAMEQMLQTLSSYDRDAIRESVVQRFGFASFGRRLLETYRSLVPERQESPGSGVCGIAGLISRSGAETGAAYRDVGAPAPPRPRRRGVRGT